MTHIVATPHANYEYRYDRALHLALLDELRSRAPGLSFSLGCDFHLSYENIVDAIIIRTAIRLGTLATCWWNCPSTAPLMLPQTLFQLQTAGHAADYHASGAKPDDSWRRRLLNRFADVGCLFQITANSLTGFWGQNKTRRCARRCSGEYGSLHCERCSWGKGPSSDPLGSARCGRQDYRSGSGRKTGECKS